MASKSSNPPDPTAGNINQIRDILIGPFQRDQEAAIARLEQSLERFGQEAEDRTARAQEKLQKSLEAAVAGLESRMADLGKRVDQLDETTRRDAANLAGEIEREMKEMNTRLVAEIQDNERATDKRFSDLRAALDVELAALRDDKTSRHDLGDYLAEIGLRLKGETSLAALDASLQDALSGGKQA